MKVLCVLGSPRKAGNTAKALAWVEDEIRFKGHEVDHVNIVEHEINGCIECYKCQEDPTKPGCVLEDDLAKLHKRLFDADAMLLATPLFCWGFTSQIKPFIDRGFCLVTNFLTPDHKSFVDGKRAALLVTAGGPEEDNSDLICTAFKRFMAFLKCKPLPPLVLPFCTTPDEMGGDVEEQARKFARDIVQ